MDYDVGQCITKSYVQCRKRGSKLSLQAYTVMINVQQICFMQVGVLQLTVPCSFYDAACRLNVVIY